jgi:hypothetical protein
MKCRRCDCDAIVGRVVCAVCAEKMAIVRKLIASGRRALAGAKPLVCIAVYQCELAEVLIRELEGAER